MNKGFSKIEIIPASADSPSVQGVTLIVDGVKQEKIRSFTLSAEAGGVFTLEVKSFIEMCAKTELGAVYETVAICADCKERIERTRKHVIADTTLTSDQWVRRCLLDEMGPRE